MSDHPETVRIMGPGGVGDLMNDFVYLVRTHELVVDGVAAQVAQGLYPDEKTMDAVRIHAQRMTECAVQIEAMLEKFQEQQRPIAII